MKYGAIVLALILTVSFVTIQPPGTASSPTVRYVGGSGPGNYSSIQDAIDVAHAGDHLYVYAGLYQENIVVDKELVIKGEEGAVVDGRQLSDTVYILADGVTLCGLTVRNSSGTGAGIVIEGNHTVVRRCTLADNFYGIYTSFYDGTIIHNTFVHNTHHAWDTGSNAWDDGSQGNYWDDYEGADDDQNGIGDSPYMIPGDDNIDRYPLLHSYGPPVARFDADIDDWTASLDGSASYDYDGTIVNWTWDLGDGNLSYGETVVHVYARDGRYTVTLTVTDNNGSTAALTRQVTVDTVAPTTTLTPTPPAPNGLQGWYASPVWITLTSSDAVSGVTSIKYRVDGGSWRDYQHPVPIDGNGHHFVMYYAVDAAGNRERERTWRVAIDRSPPLTLSQPSINESVWYTQPLTVELESTDATTGAVATYYRVNGGGFEPYTDPFTISAQGVNHLEYFAQDAAGNQEPLHRVEVRMDSVNPTLDITAPLKSYLYLLGRPLIPLQQDNFAVIIGDIQIHVQAEDATSGIQKVEFYTDETYQHTDTQAPYTWLWDEPALGPYTIEVKAYDRAGNTVQAEVPAMVFNL